MQTGRRALATILCSLLALSHAWAKLASEGAVSDDSTLLVTTEIEDYLIATAGRALGPATAPSWMQVNVLFQDAVTKKTLRKQVLRIQNNIHNSILKDLSEVIAEDERFPETMGIYVASIVMITAKP